MNWSHWLHARWVLGWAVVWHVLTLPFAGRKRDPGVWLGRIGQEALGPTPPGNWSAATNATRCIGCGLCDTVLPQGLTAAADAAGNVPAVALSQVILGAARLPSDAPSSLAFVPQLMAVADGVRAVCPTGVDTRLVAQIIQRNAEVLHPQASLLERTPGR
jgi:ferredoxin